MTGHGTLKKILQGIFLIVMVLFVFFYLRDEWQTFRQEKWQINWGVLLIACVGMSLGMGIFPIGAWLSLAYLGEKRPKSEAAYFFYLSGIAKYLPGSIWALPGRIYLYRKAGISLAKGTAALFWEISTMVLGAVTVSLLAWRRVAHEVALPLMWGGALFVVLILVVFFFAAQNGFFARLPWPEKFRVVCEKSLYLQPRQVLTLFLLYVMAWLVLGVSFVGIAYAVRTHVGFFALPALIGVFAGSWVAGFLAIFAPGGIGVRDVLIGWGLSVFLTAPAPFLIAVLSRMAWTVAEILGLTLSSLIHFHKPRPTTSP